MRKMSYSVLYPLLIFFLVQETDGLKCLRCNGVLNPLLCNRIKICDQSEICLAVKYLTGNKETLYNVGCFPRNSCVNGTIGHSNLSHPNIVAHLDADDHALCSYCCETDSCNHGTCGSEGFILNRGPICYNCPQTTDPSSCSFVRTCEDSEVCRLHEKTQLGLTFFSTSCSTKSDCQIKDQNIFGRRRRKRSLERTECCNSDLCNGQQIGNQTLQTTTSTVKPTRPSPRYRDCKEWRFLAGITTARVYDIYPDGKTAITVYCDMVTDGGGWTVVTSRNGSFNGNRSWDEYKEGFGHILGNFWLGNENMYLLTANKTNAVYFILQSKAGKWYSATYRNVSIGPESDGYKLHIDLSSYKGDAGESLSQTYGHLDGKMFTTRDRDNDFSSSNCAVTNGGGWWYDLCEYVCLTCSIHYEWRHSVGDLKTSMMMFRRVS